MTRKEEDQIVMEEGALLQQGRKKRGRPRRATHALAKDIRAAIPVDRVPLAQRLSYGFFLMAQGEDEVYE